MFMAKFVDLWPLIQKSYKQIIFAACVPLALNSYHCFADLQDDWEGASTDTAVNPDTKVEKAKQAGERKTKAKGGLKKDTAVKKKKNRQSSAEPVRKAAPKKSKTNSKQGVVQKKLPVTFEGRGLTGARKLGQVKLHSEVKVRQGDFVMSADNAIVFFDPATDDVKTVTAEGAVSMSKVDPKTQEIIKAKGDSINFDAASQVVVLTGNAELLRGKDLVKGKYIKYNMKTGWVQAGQVKGVVQSREGDSGAAK